MFRLADIQDGQRIINFLHKYWKTDHVYVREPKLFYYDFQRGDHLNFGLMEIDDDIVGVFGFFFYNTSIRPDIGGMIWQVIPDIQRRIPFAGLQLRQFVMQQVEHRFFGAPGANPDTKKIYQCLGMVWAPLEHFVGTDSAERWPSFVKTNGGVLKQQTKQVNVQPITDLSQIQTLDNKIFLYQTPIKDSDYIVRRFLCNPFRSYQIWLVGDRGKQNLIVTRRQTIKGVSILRVIELLGAPDGAAAAVRAVFNLEKSSCAYVDFVAYGFSVQSFKDLGFSQVDFSDDQSCVPNYFEPLIKKSVQIFANHDPGFAATTMVRGNGDQDRPNYVNQNV